MANRIRNAGFLDGVTDWTAFAGVTLTVDEATLGAPGRAVLTATAGDGVSLGVDAATVTLTAGEPLLIRVLAAVDKGEGVTVTLERAGSPDVLIPRVRIPTRTPRRGLSDGMALYVAQGSAPASGEWTLRLSASGAPTGSRTMVVYRPWLGEARPDGLPRPFDPGPTGNADLTLPAWPDSLRPFHQGSQISPLADRLAFETASGIARTRRLFVDPPVDMRGRLRCSVAEADDLDAFRRAGHGRFYLVRPDTDQLCIAEWLADGSPRPVEQRGPTAIYEVGLQMSVA